MNPINGKFVIARGTRNGPLIDYMPADLLNHDGIPYCIVNGKAITTDRHLHGVSLPRLIDDPGPLIGPDDLLDLAEIRELPSDPQSCGGIYFFLLAGSIVYIGQSTNLAYRMRLHHYNSKHIERDEMRFIYCDIVCLNWLEAAYIRKYKPQHNTLIP